MENFPKSFFRIESLGGFLLLDVLEICWFMDVVFLMLLLLCILLLLEMISWEGGAGLEDLSRGTLFLCEVDGLVGTTSARALSKIHFTPFLRF